MVDLIVLGRSEREDADPGYREGSRIGLTLRAPAVPLLERQDWEDSVPKLLRAVNDVERQSTGMARRAGVQKAINAVLSQKWGSEADSMEVARGKEKAYGQVRLVEVVAEKGQAYV